MTDAKSITQKRFRQFLLDTFADTDYMPIEEINQKARNNFTTEVIETGFWAEVDEMVSEGIFQRVGQGRGLKRI